ncbi:hypothetical protein CEP52_003919 [Fusarium oligoseptatum]|uniref:N-acetyltransferase domain-containing protein n=1 Tax=Fusarium oligoseptatum TaxID=2604345 RepID=A0A428U698_9HYPO|nr:hypothetical protein CEP52_003919 [Fusarium oligoseptatum]
MSLTFRPATPADIPPVLSLVRSAYRGPSSRAGWTTEADLVADERISPDLVACCEVGRRDGDHAYFGLFAVSPELQAAGIGRQVLQRAEEHAKKEWGSRIMNMWVIWKREELIAWYVRRGYRITGEKAPFPYDQLVNGSALRDDLYFEVLEKEL